MAYISKITLPNNSEYDLKDKTAHWYGVVDTVAATAEKETTINGFVLESGSRILLTFTYVNSAAAPTLTINEGTEVPFKLINDNNVLWNEGETCEFVYDGIYWNLINYDKIEVIRL